MAKILVSIAGALAYLFAVVMFLLYGPLFVGIVLVLAGLAVMGALAVDW